jgi:hypothetical protein
MHKWYKNIAVALIVIALVCVGMEVLAQCPMCRMSAESNLKNGGTAGRGLNRGILYMLAMPYVIVATIGYIWWRNNKRRNTEFDSESHDFPTLSSN